MLFQTRFSILYLGFSVIGAAFPGAFAYLLARGEMVAAPGTHEVAALWVGWALLALFSAFSLTCIALALAVPRLILTQESLFIHRPFLFWKRRIPLPDITSITEGPYSITTSHRFTDYQVFNGKEATLHLSDGRKVRFNSFEIAQYYTFVAHLQNERRRFKWKLNVAQLQRLDRQWQGYGWLCLLTLLTGALVYSLFRS
ncbi:hypothetical protein [Hymenobacter persicinus]|uniref:PH domain-containing protein n=1 Tax=Hymenobacter persicinus TaxID=2025506 RepID=A0A4Q5LDF4_9BACT|nr:hypothetical protein [Hymenobacter persicinus]RYU81320.1 hypothetical protein EWM57_07015 [Hymenobacter persicinus]